MVDQNSKIHPQAKQVRLFNTDRKTEVHQAQPTLVTPMISSKAGWPTQMQEGATIYEYDPQLTQQYDTPCFVKKA